MPRPKCGAHPGRAAPPPARTPSSRPGSYAPLAPRGPTPCPSRGLHSRRFGNIILVRTKMMMDPKSRFCYRMVGECFLSVYARPTGLRAQNGAVREGATGLQARQCGLPRGAIAKSAVLNARAGRVHSLRAHGARSAPRVFPTRAARVCGMRERVLGIGDASERGRRQARAPSEHWETGREASGGWAGGRGPPPPRRHRGSLPAARRYTGAPAARPPPAR